VAKRPGFIPLTPAIVLNRPTGGGIPIGGRFAHTVESRAFYGGRA
jgi:hypothetical protein